MCAFELSTVQLSSEGVFWRQEPLICFVHVFIFLTRKFCWVYPSSSAGCMFPSQQYWLKMKQEKKIILSLIKDIAAGEWVDSASKCGWIQKHFGTTHASEGMVGVLVMSLVPSSLLVLMLCSEWSITVIQGLILSFSMKRVLKCIHHVLVPANWIY